MVLQCSVYMSANNRYYLLQCQKLQKVNKRGIQTFWTGIEVNYTPASVTVIKEGPEFRGQAKKDVLNAIMNNERHLAQSA
jgi:hypothetical protein